MSATLNCVDAVFVFDFQPQKAKVVPTPVNFTITPDTLQNIREVKKTMSSLKFILLLHFVLLKILKRQTSFLSSEEFTAKVSNQRPFRRHQLCDQPADDWRGGGGELRRSHQEY